MELVGCYVRVAALELVVCQCMPPTCRRGECQGRVLEWGNTLSAGYTVRVIEMSNVSRRSQGDAASVPRKSVLDGSKWCTRASCCRLAAACWHGPSAKKCSKRKYSSSKSTCRRTCVGRKPSTCNQDARAYLPAVVRQSPLCKAMPCTYRSNELPDSLCRRSSHEHEVHSPRWSPYCICLPLISAS